VDTNGTAEKWDEKMRGGAAILKVGE